MREIKFRGQKSNGEWVYGDLVRSEDNILGDVTTCIFPPKAYDSYDRYIVNANTIGQFTGLLDKNGKEIYEGDIYRYDNPDSINEVSYCAGGGFAGFDLTPAIHSENRLLDVEVIGNIHDNPELLKP